MKLCPACNKPAKKSVSYPNLYVCKCLGILEDISIIKQKLIPDVGNQLFGHINFVSPRKEILGSILCASNGKLYHFDAEKYPFSLGSFIRFKPKSMVCENTTLEILCAEELELVSPVD